MIANEILDEYRALLKQIPNFSNKKQCLAPFYRLSSPYLYSPSPDFCKKILSPFFDDFSKMYINL